MKKRNRADLLQIIADFQKKILEDKPSLQEMYEEVRMMHFKIRPLQGDLSQLNFKEEKFIEILWSLGKLDEFFHRQYKKLNGRNQKEVFFKFFDNLYEKLQAQLNKLDLKAAEKLNLSATIEMEIFKENKLRKKLN